MDSLGQLDETPVSMTSSRYRWSLALQYTHSSEAFFDHFLATFCCTNSCLFPVEIPSDGTRERCLATADGAAPLQEMLLRPALVPSGARQGLPQLLCRRHVRSNTALRAVAPGWGSPFASALLSCHPRSQSDIMSQSLCNIACAFPFSPLYPRYL